MNMKVRLIAHTPQPEKVVAAAAKLCYSAVAVDELYDGLGEEKSREFVRMLAEMGHESPTEHAAFTFAIEGVSRALLAQITRHRIASFSVRSQRYVGMDGFDYVVPPELEGIPEAEALYKEAMEKDAELYRRMADILEQKHTNALQAQGVPEKEAKRRAAKTAIEDARFLLPNACTTGMVVTMNARSLNHFFRLRCCSRAQWEIRALADEMLKLACAAAPALFAKAGPGCAAGPCTEGKMTCGNIVQVRERYEAMRRAAGGVGA